MLIKANIEVIRRKLGRVVLVEDPSSDLGFEKGFFRARLGIGVMDGFKIPRKNRDKVWAAMKYEKNIRFLLFM